MINPSHRGELHDESKIHPTVLKKKTKTKKKRKKRKEKIKKRKKKRKENFFTIYFVLHKGDIT